MFGKKYNPRVLCCVFVRAARHASASSKPLFLSSDRLEFGTVLCLCFARYRAIYNTGAVHAGALALVLSSLINGKQVSRVLAY